MSSQTAKARNVNREWFGDKIHRGNSYDSNAYTYYPVVIIGAGQSGVAMACQLKEKLGFDQFRVFERQSGIGGTWWINRYPGVACDVPAVFYSFSFAQNPLWSSLYPTGEEIVNYVQGVCEKYEILDKIQVDTDVIHCRWNESEQIWDLTIQHLATRVGDLSTAEKQRKVASEGAAAVYIREEKIKAKCVISCVGGLVEPKQWPESIPGKENFQGEIFHAARWKYDIDLKDKDVIVIGTGCSAAQFVPKLRKDYGAKSVTQIMRSPPWVVPKMQSPISSDWTIWLNKNIPGYQNGFRWLVAGASENDWRWFGNSEWAATKRKEIEADLLTHMKRTVPKKYHEILTPNYAVGCKRRIFDYEWFRSLRDEKVELTTQPLTSIQDKTVTLSGRTYPSTSDKLSTAPTEEKILPADIIILGNGFETTQWLHPLEIAGRGGKGLHDVYEERGGPQMYMGCAMDDFPNFFVIFGPNTATGHSSVILASENMVQMTIRLLRPILSNHASTVEVKKSAEIEFTRDIQAELKKTVWHTGGCNSWYFNEKDQWNSTVFPYSQIWFWFRCRFLTWSDWEIKLTEKGIKRERRKKALKFLGVVGVVLGSWLVKRQGTKAKDVEALFRGALRSALVGVGRGLNTVAQRV